MTVQTKQQQIQQKKARLEYLRKQYHEMERGASKEEKAALKLHSMELQMRLAAMDR